MKRLIDYQSNIYSQFGEDGMLAFVLERLGDRVGNTCVEFGAWDGVFASNTAHLWKDGGWNAYLYESSPRRFGDLQLTTEGYPGVTIECVAITSEVLNARLANVNVTVMSIDIDGDDYFVLEGLLVQPVVLIVEFTPTIPVFLDVWPLLENQQIGCSAAALVRVAKAKGYTFVGMSPINAFFVLNEYAHMFEDMETDLYELFDPSNQVLVYACTTYTGDVFYLFPQHQWKYHDAPMVSPCYGWGGNGIPALGIGSGVSRLERPC